MAPQPFRSLLQKIGFTGSSQDSSDHFPRDFEQIHTDIIRSVQKFTMTSHERLYGLIEATRYIAKNRIPGDIVECGVWRGGSMMAIAASLNAMSDTRRELYLFDTFDGMSEPGSNDVDIDNLDAGEYLQKHRKTEEDVLWAYAPLDAVKQNLYSTGYPSEKMHFIKGKVEDTLPLEPIREIALLRLDTDWYESTRHEMEVLFPLLTKGGVLIIDDYGHWQGARKAIDEYLEKNNITILLNRLDYTGRIAVKQ